MDEIIDLAHVNSLISDHALVSAALHMNRPKTGPGNSTFRKIWDIDMDKYKNDIRTQLDPHITDLDTMIADFNSTMKLILYSHAPVPSCHT